MIPTLEEVRVWASGAAGVDPEWAARKWRWIENSHGWIRNGRLVRWQSMFKADFEEDRVMGKWPLKFVKNPAPRALWQVEKEMEIVRGLMEEHPCSHGAM
ncbi:MAG: hypothetical protein PHE83_18755, partial [Opitutaceae bacterium]|nr:hypothetical protein [Opitutaceae bacterium]